MDQGGLSNPCRIRVCFHAILAEQAAVSSASMVVHERAQSSATYVCDVFVCERVHWKDQFNISAPTWNPESLRFSTIAGATAQAS